MLGSRRSVLLPETSLQCNLDNGQDEVSTVLLFSFPKLFANSLEMKPYVPREEAESQGLWISASLARWNDRRRFPRRDIPPAMGMRGLGMSLSHLNLGNYLS